MTMTLNSDTAPINTNQTFNSAFTSATSSTAEVASDWLLPDGVHDVLFNDADKQQYLRHLLINQLQLRGYDLVTPPLLEFTETLLGNASEDLKRQTFKIIDQLSGRLMGVRADITPQILRIDSNLLNSCYQQTETAGLARYCYVGHVVHTLPTGLFGLRTPLQLGAEIFGTESLQADFELIEVISTLLNGLNLNAQVHFDLGHVAIFTRLTALANDVEPLSEETVEQLMQLYENKAFPELKVVCDSLPMGNDFFALAKYGHDLESLPAKLSMQAGSDEIINKAINDIKQLATYLKSQKLANVSVDMADLSGYHYHSGMVFNVYLNGGSHPLVRGGRFDGSSHKNINRPAIGFSMDVTRLLPYFEMALPNVVLVDFVDLNRADDSQRQALMAKVAELRLQNYRVIVPLSDTDKPSRVTHSLVLDDELAIENEHTTQWVLK